MSDAKKEISKETLEAMNEMTKIVDKMGFKAHGVVIDKDGYIFNLTSGMTTREKMGIATVMLEEAKVELHANIIARNMAAAERQQESSIVKPNFRPKIR